MRLATSALATFFLVMGATADMKVPDTSSIVSLSGRMAAAHGCPVEPWLLISSAHVFDLQPFNPSYPLVPYRGSNENWAGMVRGVHVSMGADLAFGVPDTDFRTWYRIAKAAPKAGERVWWIGYDWKNERHAFERKLFSAEVVREFSGTLILDETAQPGSSGSCVLDARGEVVGILMGTMGLENSGAVTMAVGIYEPWLKLPDEIDARAAAVGAIAQ